MELERIMDGDFTKKHINDLASIFRILGVNVIFDK